MTGNRTGSCDAFRNLLKQRIGKTPIAVFASSVGAVPNTVRNWLDGTHLPPVSKVALVAGVLRVRPAHLLRLVEAARAVKRGAA